MSESKILFLNYTDHGDVFSAQMADGLWWIKCTCCDCRVARPEMGKVRRGTRHGISMSYSLVCAKCGAPVKLSRVVVTVTLPSSAPKRGVHCRTARRGKLPSR